MRSKVVALPALAVLVTAGLIAGTTSASGAGRAKTTVTIKAEGVDLSGVVKSPKPGKCAKDRKVIVYKQKGARGGGNDTKLGSDTAGFQNGKYHWSTGNTGIEGRFYAVVRRTPDCKGDSSKTILAERET